jgi:hypothetical protein
VRLFLQAPAVQPGFDRAEAKYGPHLQTPQGMPLGIWRRRGSK